MTRIHQAGQALRQWSLARWGLAMIFSFIIALGLGFATVLLPNDFFHRDIPPTAWSYPVWIVTSVLTGLLMATYFSPNYAAISDQVNNTTHTSEEATLTDEEAAQMAEQGATSSLWGLIGTFAAWFAIGCPVCNKIALLALGYSGAITYFAPMQPWLAAFSLVLLLFGLVMRLAGEVACPVRN